MIKETLMASDYRVYEEPQSRIDPNKTLHVETGIRCPRCKTVLPVLEHGDSQSCKCGLSMTVYGNALECTIR